MWEKVCHTLACDTITLWWLCRESVGANPGPSVWHQIASTNCPTLYPLHHRDILKKGCSGSEFLECLTISTPEVSRTVRMSVNSEAQGYWVNGILGDNAVHQQWHQPSDCMTRSRYDDCVGKVWDWTLDLRYGTKSPALIVRRSIHYATEILLEKNAREAVYFFTMHDIQYPWSITNSTYECELRSTRLLGERRRGSI